MAMMVMGTGEALRVSIRGLDAVLVDLAGVGRQVVALDPGLLFAAALPAAGAQAYANVGAPGHRQQLGNVLARYSACRRWW